MPGEGCAPVDSLARATLLAGTPGQAYVERRGIPVGVAHAAGVRFAPDFCGRPAVLVGLRDWEDALVGVHGRYLETRRGQGKMLTFGTAGGLIGVLGGWRADPLILVEGLFDALSLAVCGLGCAATNGRWASWLAQELAGRTAWVAFDGSRPGEKEAALYCERLCAANVRRLPPPPRCKDWNTALAKRGAGTLRRWVCDNIAAGGRKLR